MPYQGDDGAWYNDDGTQVPDTGAGGWGGGRGTPQIDPNQPPSGSVPPPTALTNTAQTPGQPIVNPYDQDNPANRGSGGTFNTPAPGNDANQINGWISQYLGRDPSTMEVQGWMNSGKSLSDIQNAIANSGEAQTFASKGGASPQAAGGDAMTALTNSPLLQPWTTAFNYTPWQAPEYNKPTMADFYAKDPGLQARLDMGLKSMERGAASKGTLLNAGTTQAENQFAQDYASNEFGNYYNRNLSDFNTLYNSGLTSWTTNYNKALGEYQQAYNIFSNNQNNAFNKLAALSGAGQTSAAQLGSAGLGYAQLNTNTLTNQAGTLGNLFGQGANAQAAGRVGSGNAWGQALGNLSNMASLYASSYGKTA